MKMLETEKIAWYLNRLKLMDPPEIGYRARQAIRSRMEGSGMGRLQEIPNPVFPVTQDPWIRPPESLDPGPYYRAAERILDGELSLFALKEVKILSPPEWNRDPLTGTLAPLRFGKQLDYRDFTLVGDIKYLWELNRHLFLVPLAQAYALGGSSRYLDRIGSLLDSWFEQCPPMIGPNWSSSLELGIRLINWAVVWQLIGGLRCPLFAERQDFLMRWMHSVYEHVRFIRGNFSRFSSANNHLIGEASGIAVACSTWPFWPQTTSWKEEARTILFRELAEQHAADGVNREQAVSYQQFVMDFYLLALVSDPGNPFPATVMERFRTLFEFLASIMDCSGNVPMIGDGDDGFVTSLSQEEGFCPFGSLLATGAVLFGDPRFKRKAGKLDHKTRWLFAPHGDGLFRSLACTGKSLPVRRAFHEGGYFLLGQDFEGQGEVRLIVDAGPLGYLSLAAHGHADALSVHLSVSGEEFLIDPGTYAYHTNERWRNSFRGTAAHNTVRIDGRDQSIAGGKFMWIHKANAECESFSTGPDEDRFVGVHDGYLNLPDPVLHRREIHFLKAHGEIEFIDSFECRGRHLVELFWHFHEACEVRLNEGTVRAERTRSVLTLRGEGQEVEFALHRGDETFPCGWVSRRFDHKEPTGTVRAFRMIDGTTSIRTFLAIHWKEKGPEVGRPGHRRELLVGSDGWNTNTRRRE
jgi:hypothetical protein